MADEAATIGSEATADLPNIEGAAQAVADAIRMPIKAVVQYFTDGAYGAIMEAVQDYLVDNASFNIGQRITSAEAENRRLNLRNYLLNRQNEMLLPALKAIVDFCDDPDGSEKGLSLAIGLSGLLPAARTAVAMTHANYDPAWTDGDEEQHPSDGSQFELGA